MSSSYDYYYIGFQGNRKGYGTPENLKISFRADSALSLRKKISEFYEITGRVELLNQEQFLSSGAREVRLDSSVPSIKYSKTTQNLSSVLAGGRL